MTTIAMNTQTGAVSEHTIPFAELTARFACSAAGLFELGGNTDAGAAIAASFKTPSVLVDESAKNRLSDAYLSMEGAGRGVLTVHGKSAQWAYQFEVLPAGVSRVPLGRGIRENYLGFTYANVGGADFRFDRLEVRSFQSQRRI
jgi:hypothetical protein